MAQGINTTEYFALKLAVVAVSIYFLTHVGLAFWGYGSGDITWAEASDAISQTANVIITGIAAVIAYIISRGGLKAVFASVRGNATPSASAPSISTEERFKLDAKKIYQEAVAKGLIND